MMSLWDALRMNMMISYQELVRTFLKKLLTDSGILISLATDLVIACDIRELIGRYQKPTF